MIIYVVVSLMDIVLKSILKPFTLILLAELGDKTQICTILLSAKSPSLSVFSGAMAAFFVVDGLSALLGGKILSYLPENVVKLMAGAVFLVFGIISLFHKGGDARSCGRNEASLIKVFALIALLELGDKTQFFSIFLAAESENPLLALAGIMMAFAVITCLGVLLGNKLLRALPEKYLRIGSAIVFITLGLIQLLEVMPGINIPL